MIYKSAAGELEIAFGKEGVVMIDWVENPRHQMLKEKLLPYINESPCPAIVDLLVAQLDEYFDRRRTRFDLPVELHGTRFQLNVWKALGEIPYGTTLSYSKLASNMGISSSVRAVAGAVARNPVNILVPCHRVVAASGHGGYAGGIQAKLTLLDLELS